ncbi:M61 family metallopeptidase [Aquiflexum gelatinilyticum]|uniref:M61 family peptidase n=1 Tax=Aquiflexum gelatinilyticum TaxID=2961943 RepID=A0A9X2T4S3_9BACT|nr:M61 family peptidase [Aquiflexum gelatinilyticum]MCR9017465.1 M61 family peptidase [Aquiflexum gelatinilyticum]
MHYSIFRKSFTSQFIQIRLEINCFEKQIIHLQLPAWRPGRYELANYAQKIRNFELTYHETKLPWKKTSKDLWEFIAPVSGLYVIQYEYYCNQMDAGGCWSDDEQLYLNFSNFIFDIQEGKNEEIYITIELPNDYQVATALENIEGNKWKAGSFQHLMDSPFLASAGLKHFSYDALDSKFHVWIQGEIHFDVTYFQSVLKSITDSQIKDFGEFPAEDYHFIFQLLSYRHFHGVEHAFSTVITYGPAYALSDKSELDELIGVSSHELYHFWNVCRIRPSGILTYDLSKEVYLNEGLVMEGVTTYMGDYYLLKSGYLKFEDYIDLLQKQIQREFDSLGWRNQSIVESSFDLWLDGYKPGIPDKKVSIYNRGALISLCLDLMLKSSGSSLSELMKEMWEKFGKTRVGYNLGDFENLIRSLSKEGEKITSFFQSFVFGKEDLLTLIKELLAQIGIEIIENFEGDGLLHHWGIRKDESGIITQLHPDSGAYAILMKNDKILEYDFENATNDQINFKIERLGKIKEVPLSKNTKKYFPKFIIQIKEDDIFSLNKLLGE